MSNNTARSSKNSSNSSEDEWVVLPESETSTPSPKRVTKSAPKDDGKPCQKSKHPDSGVCRKKCRLSWLVAILAVAVSIVYLLAQGVVHLKSHRPTHQKSRQELATEAVIQKLPMLKNYNGTVKTAVDAYYNFSEYLGKSSWFNSLANTTVKAAETLRQASNSTQKEFQKGRGKVQSLLSSLKNWVSERTGTAQKENTKNDNAEPTTTTNSRNTNQK